MVCVKVMDPTYLIFFLKILKKGPQHTLSYQTPWIWRIGIRKDKKVLHGNERATGFFQNLGFSPGSPLEGLGVKKKGPP